MCCNRCSEGRAQGLGLDERHPGLGFLKERFSEPYLFHWTLGEDVTTSLTPAVVPLRAVFAA